MQITVKLFGTLGQNCRDYRSDRGIELEMAEGSRVADLLALLKIPGSQGGTVVMQGRFLQKEEILADGSLIQIFQALHGG
jgi:sulfur carrier protein ThiS